jgi:hypothetical protein
MTPEPRSGRRLMAWLYVPALVGLTVVLLLRQSGVGATNTMWAEDGAVFYRDALTHSAASNLVRTYNGYIQLLPRLIFEVIRFVPLSDVAFVVAVTGAALVAGLSLVVFRSSASHIRSPLLRGLLVAAIILLPVSPNELLDNVVNVSWWMILASFWLLIWRPRSWSGRAVAGIVCFLAAASDPIVILLLPIAILRVVALRRASENSATIGLLAGIFFQLAVIATSHSSSSYQPGGSWPDLVRTFGVRVGLGAVTGVRVTDNLWSVHPLLASILGLGVFVGLLGIVALKRDRQLRSLVALVLGESVLLFFVPVVLRDAVPTLLVEPVWFASRWQAVPALLVLGAVVAGTDRYISRRRGAPWLAIVVAIALCPAWILDFQMVTPRTAGPAWNRQVAIATRECETGRGTHVSLQISPPGWSVPLACRLVDEAK